MNTIIKDVLRKLAIFPIAIPLFLMLLIVVYIIVTTSSILTYKTIKIQLPEIASFIFVTQVKDDAIFSKDDHYRYIITSDKKSKKELKQSEGNLVFLGEHFCYYTISPDTLHMRGEIISHPVFSSINGAIVVLLDDAHITEQCNEFVYDNRYKTLVPKDELGKVVFITDADFEAIRPF